MRERDVTEGSEQQGIKSLEIGFRIALILAEAGEPRTFGEIANTVGLPASKTHRYLVSLCRAGILSQNQEDGRYRIGSRAIFLGLRGQRMLDEHQQLEEVMRELHRKSGMTVAAASWGSYGPVVIRRIEKLDETMMISPRIGSTLSMVTTASGRVFAAFMPRDKVDALIAAELQAGRLGSGDGRLTEDEFRNLVDQVRRDRFCAISNFTDYQYSAISVPVFSISGILLFAISVVLPMNAHLGAESAAARLVKRAAQQLESALGGGLEPGWPDETL